MLAIERIKTHIHENRKLYLGIGIGAVVTALVTTKACQINYKSDGATNIFVEAPKRNMHPGYVVRDNETGMVYPSIRATVKATEMKHSQIKLSDRFDILGEAVA